MRKALYAAPVGMLRRSAMVAASRMPGKGVERMRLTVAEYVAVWAPGLGGSA